MRRIKSSLTRVLGLSVMAASLVAAPAIAQTLAKPGKFPERPVTVYVPYGPGGGSDQLSRAWAEAMRPVLGIGMQVVTVQAVAAWQLFQTLCRPRKTVTPSFSQLMTPLQTTPLEN